MALIQTKAGVINETNLTREILTYDEDASLTVAVEWKWEDTGELMRRDVWVVMKRGLMAAPEQGAPG